MICLMCGEEPQAWRHTSSHLPQRPHCHAAKGRNDEPVPMTMTGADGWRKAGGEKRNAKKCTPRLGENSESEALISHFSP